MILHKMHANQCEEGAHVDQDKAHPNELATIFFHVHPPAFFSFSHSLRDIFYGSYYLLSRLKFYEIFISQSEKISTNIFKIVETFYEKQILENQLELFE